MNTCVIGIGYWGPNILRNFISNSRIKSASACDINPQRLKFIGERYPMIDVYDDYKKVLADPSIDAVAIATPVNLHYPMAKEALLAGKHVWVEKPLSYTSAHCEELVELADKHKLSLFVDHTFIYTSAVQKIREIVRRNELGDILYFDSVRVNLGLFQHDVNVIWDLAAHDISIMSYVMEQPIVAVVAHGIANYNSHENLAHISLYFKENCFAHFHVNWTSPVKIRRILIGGNKKMLVYDDMQTSEKVKVYDSGVKISTPEGRYDVLVQYRMGDMYAPQIHQNEALAGATDEFVDSIINAKPPLTDGRAGLKVVKILEAADASIKNRGKLIKIE
jgi:predicted dehydrogenase